MLSAKRKLLEVLIFCWIFEENILGVLGFD